MKPFPFLPHNDGKDHVNLYSKSATLAGRVLTHMSSFPVTVGGMTFNTLEGYWYYRRVDELLSRQPRWVGTRNEAEWVQALQAARSGFDAKKVGRSLLSHYGEGEPKTEMSEEFRQHIRDANKQRIEQNKFLKAVLLSTDGLPLTHYYYYGVATNARVIHEPVYDWIPEYLMVLRKEYLDTIPRESIDALILWAHEKTPLRPQYDGLIIFDSEKTWKGKSS